MPYPDNFDSHAFDRRWGGPSEQEESALARWQEAQEALRDALASVGKAFEAKGFSLHADDVLGVVQCLEDVLYDQLSDTRDTLNESGIYYGDLDELAIPKQKATYSKAPVVPSIADITAQLKGE